MARPRNQTETEALQAALLLFWEKGYDRTSLADLSKALGVGPSSIYSTFGSKADLFRKALQRYMAEYAHFVPDMIARAPEAGAEITLKQLMRGAAELYSTKGQPCGCAVLEGGGTDRSDSSEGGNIAAEFTKALEAALVQLFKGAPKSEPLAQTPRLLAKYTLGVMRGLSQLSRDGTPRADLIKIADFAAGSCFVLSGSIKN
jgi:AcrR family transcriptional regulator